MNRRQWLQSAGLLVAGCASSSIAFALPADSSRPQRRLVVVFLRGAVDGLNVVVPYGESEYYQARPNIAVARPGQPDGVLDLDGHFGLHPALAPLMPLWASQRMAFVQASGSPDTTRSHFDAQDYMESGTPGVKNTASGWMNRLLGALGRDHGGSPLRAVSVGPTLPRIVAGPARVATIASGAAAARPTVLDNPRLAQAFGQMYQGDDPLSRSVHDAEGERHAIMTDLSADPGTDEREMRAANNGAAGANGFPGDAERLATLMRRDPSVQLAFMAVGGWDTHANEGHGQGQLAQRLKPLGQGLAALIDGMGPAADETVILVMSEFGRTVRENGNRGTDHGHGNVMWLLGNPVAGGKVYGAWPGLSTQALYEGRDLAVTTDFRSVIGCVLERHVGLPDASLDTVLPAAPAPFSGKLLRA